MGQDEKSEARRARLAALSAEKRARLLDPAETAFAAQGFEAASLNKILAEAGMSKGQAYYYVSDKADLYAAVIERAFGRLLARIEPDFAPPADAEAFWDALGRFFARLTEILQADPRLAALGRGVYESAQSQAALAGPMARLEAWMERLVASGQKVGALRADLPRSLLLAMLLGAGREIDRWFAENWDALDAGEAARLNAATLGMLRAMTAPVA